MMKKTKQNKPVNATSTARKAKALSPAVRAKRASNLIKSGRYKQHIGNATPAKSSKYALGQLVVSVDPWKQYDHDLTFVKSVRWPGGGGYLVLDKFGKPHTTTNIRPAKAVKAAQRA